MSFLRSGDIDTSWKYISQGVDALMTRELANLGLTPEVYMNMYTAIHNFCVSTHPVSSKQYAAQRGARSHHTKLLGGDLYARLVEHLRAYLVQLRREAPEQAAGQSSEAWQDSVLDFYNRSWARYVVGAKYLDHIFSYLNRHWVKQERDEGGRNRGIYEVHTLCLVMWRDWMFLPLEDVLIPVLLGAIRRDRDSKPVNHKDLQNAIQSMVSVGFDDQNSKRTNLLFYTEHFERAFIEDTSRYYYRESEELLSTQGVVTYMRRIVQRLARERERVTRYLHASSEDILMSECEQILIQDHAAQIQSEFLGLLVLDRREDLHTMFTLLHKIPFGLDPIKKNLESFVEQSGMDRIKLLVEGTAASGAASGASGGATSAAATTSTASTATNVEPKQYVEALLEVSKKFETLLRDSFDMWPAMKEAIDAGFAKFINYNAVAKPNSAVESRTPELLSRYADSLLKKSARVADQTQVQDGIDGMLGLLHYTEEKDVFEKHYSRLLSRRLVLQASSSQELELKLVKRLGEICGFEYTNKLQRMFQDVLTSQKLQLDFKREEESPLASNFLPFVLAKGFWPLPYREVPDFELPEPLKPTFDHFVDFYDRAHNGRKLKWLWNFGKGEMKLNLANGKTVLLQVSIYQMMILLAFNDADTLTRQQLLADTRLPAELLDGSLAYIVKSGVLAEPAPGTYAYNAQFKSKRMRINLNLPLKTTAYADAGDSEKQLEEQRQTFLQAVIVRVMKARQHLNHAQLVEEAMQQAVVRFRPSVKDVKYAVETLLEREYLKRVGERGDEYEYAA